MIKRFTWLVGTWCADPRTGGGLEITILVKNNIALVGKSLWRFTPETETLWHRVIRSKYALQRNGWDANRATLATHACPWKFISQVSPILFPEVRLK